MQSPAVNKQQQIFTSHMLKICK